MGFDIDFFTKEGRSVEQVVYEEALLFFLGSSLSLLLLKGYRIGGRSSWPKMPRTLILLESASFIDPLDDGDKPGAESPLGGRETFTTSGKDYFFSRSVSTSGRSRSFI